ncbi:MAG TPA: hypothetical protein VHY32_00045 [Caulobacteraceae bacterium]|jgi:hypothetical protein|nr:hypothetical protein [Caulobacteraceae bacterium]
MALKAAGLRQIHTYIGAFIAPSVLFFAATGALQLFSLHEAHGDYKPPVLFEKLGALHKDQAFAAESDHHDGPPPSAHGAKAAPADDDDHDHPPATPPRAWALKWLFLTVAIGLIVSTVLGVWMAITLSRRKAVVWTLLILGAALPILILVL